MRYLAIFKHILVIFDVLKHFSPFGYFRHILAIFENLHLVTVYLVQICSDDDSVFGSITYESMTFELFESPS